MGHAYEEERRLGMPAAICPYRARSALAPRTGPHQGAPWGGRRFAGAGQQRAAVCAGMMMISFC